MGDEKNLESLVLSDEICPTPETLYLGYTCHVFEIEANDKRFRVSVVGTETTVIETTD